MRIEYFMLKDQDSDELAGFTAIHENSALKEFYQKKEKAVLETQLYVMDQSIIPFLNDTDVLSLLQKEDLSCLPLVKVNGKIFVSKRLLSLHELSALLEIGITLQKNSPLT